MKQEEVADPVFHFILPSNPASAEKNQEFLGNDMLSVGENMLALQPYSFATLLVYLRTRGGCKRTCNKIILVPNAGIRCLKTIISYPLKAQCFPMVPSTSVRLVRQLHSPSNMSLLLSTNIEKTNEIASKNVREQLIA
ncbi:hypothetical protein VNO77_21316 [Canavalia gladiata]|uniref:Uncharacterized protein n=1 Tax=Canavalia gladiata TaxID=3824 RepID=A0AAN9QRE9_CANGL